MRFSCTKENLVRALDLVGGIASKHASLPILSNILFEVGESGVKIVSTNLELAARAHVRAKVEETGSFTVPAKTFIDFIRLLSDEQVTLLLEEQELVVTSGHSSTRIKGMPAEEFPVVPEVGEGSAYVIDAVVLRTALSEVVIAAAKNEIRPELSGVYCGLFTEAHNGAVFAATDSYRLAETRQAVEQGIENSTCIIPAKTTYEIIRIIGAGKQEESESGVRLWLSNKQLSIRFNNVELTSRLVDGIYPDYTQIIPEVFKTTATTAVDVLIKNIKAASLFTTTGVNAVSFDLNASKNTIGVSSTSTQTGAHSAEIDAGVVGEENSILLNHRYVLDGLGHMDGDVQFQVNSSDSPCLFRPKDREGYVYIVMPIRQ